MKVRTALSPFTYLVLRCAQDRVSGEALNVGVVLHAPEKGFLEARYSYTAQRLSQAFSGFDVEGHRRALSWLERSLEPYREQAKASTLSFPGMTAANIEEVLRQIWTDNGLSVFYSEMRSGVTDDPQVELDYLYERFVSSQYDEVRRPMRNDNQVWQVYQEALRRVNITHRLEPRVFKVSGFEFRYEHAFKNGSWRAFQPVTMDYADKRSIRDRVTRLVGESQVLSKRSDLGKLYILLGKPTDPSHFEEYEEAVGILREELRVDSEVVEEENRDAFAARLAADMARHGLMAAS